jgi:Protein of unknown function (DUF559)
VCLLPGVLAIAGAPIGWEAWVLAGCLRAAPGAAASGSTAGLLWGLVERKREQIEVATTRNIREAEPTSLERPPYLFHRVSRLPPEQIAVVHGIPVTCTERTLLDIAGRRARWVFNEALDRALRHELSTLERLADFLECERRSGMSGVRRLRAAIEARTPEVGHSRSALEREFLFLLQDEGLPLPEINQEIRGPEGFVAVVDFLYRDARLVIEIQSYAHHSSLEAFNRDAERLATLTALGFRPIQVTADQIRRQPDQTLERIRALLNPVSWSRSAVVRS